MRCSWAARLLVGWLFLTISQLGILVLRPAFPINNEHSTCLTRRTTIIIEHICRYLLALGLTVTVRIWERKTSTNIWLSVFCTVLGFQLLFVFCSEYLTTPMFIEKQGWVQKAVE